MLRLLLTCFLMLLADNPLLATGHEGAPGKAGPPGCMSNAPEELLRIWEKRRDRAVNPDPPYSFPCHHSEFLVSLAWYLRAGGINPCGEIHRCLVKQFAVLRWPLGQELWAGRRK